MSSPFAVIGIGNLLFKDEGLGVYAAKYLEENYQFSPPVELIDGGTLGLNMIHLYQRYERVIILDTISVEGSDEAGTIYNLNADALQGLGDCRKTAHEIEVLQTLELGALAGDMADIQIIAMVPEDMTEVSMSITPTVMEAMPQFIEAILAELAEWRVVYELKENGLSLPAIIERYNQQQASSPSIGENR